MKKILVLGAAGYIGSRLSWLLAKSGYQVTALCYPRIPNNAQWLAQLNQVKKLDVTNYDALEKLSDESFDTAIHLVSLDHHDSNKSPEYVNAINVMPIWNLLELFKQKGTLGKFIYFSTVHVYGKFPEEYFDESLPPNPLTPYGLTHLMGENLCNMYSESTDMECLVFRLSNSYGEPSLESVNCWSLVINDLCRTAFTEKSIRLKSDGTALRDFIHYSDIFSAVESVVNASQSLEHRLFHLSSGITRSILEIAEIVREAYISRYQTQIDIHLPQTSSQQRQSNPRYQISNERLKTLVTKKQTDIYDGVGQLFSYLESNYG